MERFYDYNEAEIVYAKSMDAVCEELQSDDYEMPVEVRELVESPKSGVRYCREEVGYFEPECGTYCEDYKPRNGKNGICKSLGWSLYPTGRIFIVTDADEYEYHLKEVKTNEK